LDLKNNKNWGLYIKPNVPEKKVSEFISSEMAGIGIYPNVFSRNVAENYAKCAQTASIWNAPDYQKVKFRYGVNIIRLKSVGIYLFGQIPFGHILYKPFGHFLFGYIEAHQENTTTEYGMSHKMYHNLSKNFNLINFLPDY